MCNDLTERFAGINSSQVVVLGSIQVTVRIDNIAKENIRMLVVLDSTMRNSVILGRDTLRIFKLGLSTQSVLVEAETPNEIMFIEVVNALESKSNDIEINPEVGYETQSAVRQLFATEYLNAERPESPQTDM